MNPPDNPYLAPGAALDPVAEPGSYQPRLFALKGRIGLLRYLAYMLALFGIVMAVGFVLTLVISLMATRLDGWYIRPEYAALVPGMLALLLVVPYAALMVRRMNDTGHTGWFVLLSIVPFVNLALGLYLLCARGSAGPNKYGLPQCENTLAVQIGGWTMVAAIIVSLGASFLMPFMMAARTGGVSGF